MYLSLNRNGSSLLCTGFRARLSESRVVIGGGEGKMGSSTGFGNKINCKTVNCKTVIVDISYLFVHAAGAHRTAYSHESYIF